MEGMRVLQGSKELLEPGQKQANATLKLHEIFIRACITGLLRNFSSKVTLAEKSVLTVSAHPHVDINLALRLF